MTRGRIVLAVAAWEFRRWFKIRDQLITLVLSLAVGLAVWGGMELLSRERTEPVDLVVLGAGRPALPEGGRLRAVDAGGRSMDELRRAVDAGEIGGVVEVGEDASATLLVRREPAWLPELRAVLGELRRASGLERLGLTAAQLGALLQPPEIDVTYTGGGARTATRAAKITAVVVVILMIVGVGLGLALQFVAITGEKQLRVTEQVVSAISPQTWIDGKIVGISLVALASLVTYLVGALLFVLASRLFGRPLPIPIELLGPSAWLAVLPVALAGFLFWNTVYAAFAATIDDPNTSARGTLIMLPFLPLALALFRIGNPDTALTQALAVFPITAPAFLPLRVLLADVPVWEAPLALLLLLVATALVRRAAGKIFGMGILMYGKEPGIGEMLRWIRSA